MSDLRREAKSFAETSLELLNLPTTLGDNTQEFINTCANNSQAMSLLAISVHLDRIATALERE